MSALIQPDWLADHLHDANVRIIEASVAKATYDDGHIPGARWLDCHRELLLHGDDSSGEVIPPEQFAALMGRLGVAPETTVVWYGDRHNSFAIRGFWTMDYYRHPGPIYVLDGGRERWNAEARPMTAELPRAELASYPAAAMSDESNRATIDQVRNAIGSDDRVVLDVRARDEYDGTAVRAARGGHVPGALHIEWTDATAGDSTLQPADDLRSMYESRGVTPDKQIIAHCQLGIRAVHTWFVLKHVLGYPDVRNYAGSWQEWGNREDTPVVRD